MPYLSRRLLSDNSPRMRAALRQLLYGDKARVDVVRLRSMVNAFSSFTTGAWGLEVLGAGCGEAGLGARSGRGKGGRGSSRQTSGYVGGPRARSARGK